VADVTGGSNLLWPVGTEKLTSGRPLHPPRDHVGVRGKTPNGTLPTLTPSVTPTPTVRVTH